MKKYERLLSIPQKMKANGKANIIDDENQLIELPISSTQPVYRNFNGYEFMEVLTHTPEAVDLTRANDGAAVMNQHGGNQIGVFENARVADNRVYAQIRFSKNNPEAVVAYKDIKDGVVRNFSIDYEYKEMTATDQKLDGFDLVTVNRWNLLGVSLAPIPADASVGAGRSRTEKLAVVETKGTTETQNKIEVTRSKNMADQEEILKEAIEAEGKRRDVIEAVSDKFSHIEGMRELAKKAKESRMSEDEFRKLAMARIAEKGILEKKETIQSGAEFMTVKDTRSYSLSKMIRTVANGGSIKGTLEGDVHDEMVRKYGNPTKGTIHIPLAALSESVAGRDNTSVPGNKGGYLIQNQYMDFVELLRNKAMTIPLGAQMLAGATGDLVFPTQTSANTLTFGAENGKATTTDTGYGQILSRPKYGRALNLVSRSLIEQSNPSIEALVRADLAAIAAIGMDNEVLNGTGGQRPVGIIKTTGVGSVSTATISTTGYSKMLGFESAVAAANADFGTQAFLTTPGVRKTLKSQIKTGSTANYLWEGKELVGYNAAVSNNVLANNIVFGDWSQVLIPIWSLEIDILKTQRYSDNGLIDIPLFLNMDVVVRYPAAFAVSTDFSA